MPVLAEVNYSRGIEDAWARVTTFVPKFLAFLVVLVIGILVAKAIAKAVDGVLVRVGFDRAVERGGIKHALESSKYDASDIVGKVVYYALFLFVLQLAFGLFGPNPVSTLLTAVIAYLPKVFAAIVIVVVAAALAAGAKELIEASLSGLSYGKALSVGASVAILTIGGFAALNQLQIAPAIVNGMFYAVLAIIVGSSVIAIGGGGIAPMRSRWESALAKWDEQKPELQQQMQGAGDRIGQRTQELKAKASDQMGGGAGPGSTSRNT